MFLVVCISSWCLRPLLAFKHWIVRFLRFFASRFFFRLLSVDFLLLSTLEHWLVMRFDGVMRISLLSSHLCSFQCFETFSSLFHTFSFFIVVIVIFLRSSFCLALLRLLNSDEHSWIYSNSCLLLLLMKIKPSEFTSSVSWFFIGPSVGFMLLCVVEWEQLTNFILIENWMIFMMMNHDQFFLVLLLNCWITLIFRREIILLSQVTLAYSLLTATNLSSLLCISCHFLSLPLSGSLSVVFQLFVYCSWLLLAKFYIRRTCNTFLSKQKLFWIRIYVKFSLVGWFGCSHRIFSELFLTFCRQF